jgi:hypothetical protein
MPSLLLSSARVPSQRIEFIANRLLVALGNDKMYNVTNPDFTDITHCPPPLPTPCPHQGLHTGRGLLTCFTFTHFAHPHQISLPACNRVHCILALRCTGLLLAEPPIR